MKKWEKLSTEVINENPWTEFRHDRFRLPSGKEGDYYYLSSNGAVAVIPVHPDGTISLHRQYRFLFDRVSLEFTAGGIEQGETPEEAAIRELAEELNFRARHYKQVGQFAPSNGNLKAMADVFVVWDLEAEEAPSDETEVFEICRMTPEEIDQAIYSGEMWDGFCITPWFLARPFVDKLVEQQKGEN